MQLSNLALASLFLADDDDDDDDDDEDDEDEDEEDDDDVRFYSLITLVRPS